MTDKIIKYVADVQNDRLVLDVAGSPVPTDWAPRAAVPVDGVRMALAVKPGEAIGQLLEQLRDQGFAFLDVPNGWPPAAVFSQLRETGKVSGQYTTISFRGPGAWRLRTIL